MDTFLPKFIDAFLRRHPLIMWTGVGVFAVVACWVLISTGHSHLVYEGF